MGLGVAGTFRYFYLCQIEGPVPSLPRGRVRGAVPRSDAQINRPRFSYVNWRRVCARIHVIDTCEWPGPGCGTGSAAPCARIEGQVTKRAFGVYVARCSGQVACGVCARGAGACGFVAKGHQPAYSDPTPALCCHVPGTATSVGTSKISKPHLAIRPASSSALTKLRGWVILQ